MTSRRPMSARRAREIVAGTRLVKAPTWAEDRHWHVAAEDGTVLVTVAPSYGGTSRSGRNGWRYWLTDLGPSGNRDRWTTREAAAAAGLGAWQRWATAPRR